MPICTQLYIAQLSKVVQTSRATPPPLVFALILDHFEHTSKRHQQLIISPGSRHMYATGSQRSALSGMYRLLLSITSNITGGRDPPPPLHIVGVKKSLWRQAFRSERLSTSCGVSYPVQCVHKDFFTPTLCKGGSQPPVILIYDWLSLVAAVRCVNFVPSQVSVQNFPEP